MPALAEGILTPNFDVWVVLIAKAYISIDSSEPTFLHLPLHIASN